MINSVLPFVLHEEARHEDITPWFVNSMDLKFPFGPRFSFDLRIPDFFPVDFPDGPGFIHISGEQTVGNDPRQPRSSPGPSQCAGQITMIWTKSNTDVVEYHYDETVGQPAPAGVVTFNDRFSHDGAHGGMSGSFYGLEVIPHRDDGYPAVIAVNGLKKWYHKGELRRRFADCNSDPLVGGNPPTVQADYVGAIWMENGTPSRTNGPTKILVEDYYEYHQRGSLRKRHHKWIHEEWSGQEPTDLEGEKQPLSVEYFTDVQDAMIHAAQNIS